jgi:hypothetical protein
VKVAEIVIVFNVFYDCSIDSEHNKRAITLVQREANEASGEQQYSIKDIKGSA